MFKSNLEFNDNSGFRMIGIGLGVEKWITYQVYKIHLKKVEEFSFPVRRKGLQLTK
jgi:hypothetical protein